MGFNLQPNCSINALGLVVPAGTPGAIQSGTTNYVYGLINPTPGNLGTLGARSLTYPGQFDLDMNMSKTFRLTESKSMQVRIDTKNVLNHPSPNLPGFSVNPTSANNTFIGEVTGKGGSRTFQGQVRVNF